MKHYKRLNSILTEDNLCRESNTEIQRVHTFYSWLTSYSALVLFVFHVICR